MLLLAALLSWWLHSIVCVLFESVAIHRPHPGFVILLSFFELLVFKFIINFMLLSVDFNLFLVSLGHTKRLSQLVPFQA